MLLGSAAERGEHGGAAMASGDDDRAAEGGGTRESVAREEVDLAREGRRDRVN